MSQKRTFLRRVGPGPEIGPDSPHPHLITRLGIKVSKLDRVGEFRDTAGMKTPSRGGLLVGYARVSTEDQNLDLQNDALRKAGCAKLFTDIASGAQDERTGLAEALAYLRPGDTLVVWKLDRLGRSLKHLIETVTALQARTVGFRSLQESIDTTTSGGKLVFHVFGALAEFERDLIRERTQAGLQAARARGRTGGRPRALDEKRRALARSLHQDPSHPVGEICRMLGISRATFYRYLASGDQRAGGAIPACPEVTPAARRSTNRSRPGRLQVDRAK
jgi:DNA invertase Pin-like site-specific DNA recombinase